MHDGMKIDFENHFLIMTRLMFPIFCNSMTLITIQKCKILYLYPIKEKITMNQLEVSLVPTLFLLY